MILYSIRCCFTLSPPCWPNLVAPLVFSLDSPLSPSQMGWRTLQFGRRKISTFSDPLILMSLWFISYLFNCDIIDTFNKMGPKISKCYISRWVLWFKWYFKHFRSCRIGGGTSERLIFSDSCLGNTNLNTVILGGFSWSKDILCFKVRIISSFKLLSNGLEWMWTIEPTDIMAMF